MHQNSRLAFEAINRDGTKKTRSEMILEVFAGKRKFTDYQVLQKLKPGSDNLNFVRPRITELIQSKKLRECGNVMDARTGKQVRVVMLYLDQTELFE